MELGLGLGLRLGDAPRTLGFRGSDLALGLGLRVGEGVEEEDGGEGKGHEEDNGEKDLEEPLQLDLLPLLPCPSRLRISSTRDTKNLHMNRTPSADKGAAGLSSPNSTSSSFPVTDYAVCEGREGEGERAAPLRLSDDDENGMARKKLRLSKEQSGFLEESFKEHSTLNPKEKVALAKQLNLQARQVEVWFQNRRARTKLKQTEVDCEHLKRRCQTLTEENRRLHKELADLRALNISHSLYTHVPATTLSMCPSCQRVASTSSAATSAAEDRRPNSLATLFSQPDPSQVGSQAAPAALHQPSHAF